MGEDTELKGWYEFHNWIPRMGSEPIELVEHYVDADEDYSTTRVHLFRLKNNQFALVNESGCSCYGPEDADIELYPTLIAGREAFAKAEKYGRKDETHTAPCKLCGAHG